MEELQEADVLWPWPDTPPPVPELYEFDDTVVDFSCEPFSELAVASSSLSSASTSSALLFDRSSGSEDGFFLSGPSSTVASGLAASAEEFLEADVLWPDTAADEAHADAAEFWCCCCRRVEEAAAAAAARGKRDGWRTMVSSPINIPVVTRAAAAACHRISPSAVPVHRRR